MKTWINAPSILFFSALVLPSLSALPASADEGADGAEPRGVVLTMSNATSGNALLVFDREADGSLSDAGTIATGGVGTGAGLGSQGALAREGDWLFVVNAGSNDISVFSLAGGRPTLASRTPSGGVGPISVTARGALVYVLNGTTPENISGFRLDERGELHPIDGATRPLSASGVGPAQVSFTPAGDALVVTEKNTNRIDAFAVDRRGVAAAAVVTAANGTTPFGFGFTPRGELITSEASGGVAGAAAVSAYDLTRDGDARIVSGSVPDGQTAACWVAVADDGRRAFTTNAGSGDISAYGVDEDGRLSLDGVVAQTGEGSHPVDMAVTGGSRFLYVLANGVGTIGGYAIGQGALRPAAQITGVPASAQGIVAW